MNMEDLGVPAFTEIPIEDDQMIIEVADTLW